MLKINAVTVPDDDWYGVLPEIKLTGEWLKRLGFEPGQKVTVISSEKVLVIQLVVDSLL